MKNGTLKRVTRRAVSLLLAVLTVLPAPAAWAADTGEVEPNKTTTKFVLWDWDTDLQKLGKTVDANSSDTANHYQRIMFYQQTSVGRYYFNVDGTTGGYSRFDEDRIYYPSTARIENSVHKEWNQDLIDFDHFVTMGGVNTPYITWAEQAHDGWHAWRLYGAAADDSRSEFALCQVDDYENLDLRRTYDNGTTIRYGAKNDTYRCDPWIIRGHDNDQRFYHWDNDTASYNEDLYFVHDGKYLKSSNYQKDYFKTYLGKEIAVPTLAADFRVDNDQITTLGRPIFYIPKGRTLTVESGGVLSVNGLILNDGCIEVKDGGLLILKEGARIMPFTKYGLGGNGSIKSYGTIVVERNAVLCGGGETGLWISGGNLTNFGVVCGENMTLRAREVVDNRENGYIAAGKSPSRAMRIQMIRDAWDGVETDAEDIKRSLTKVEDIDSNPTVVEGAFIGRTDQDHISLSKETAVTVGTDSNPVISIYTKGNPWEQEQLLFTANMDSIDLRVDGNTATYTVSGQGTHKITNQLVSASLGRGGTGAEKLFTNLWAGDIENGWLQLEPECAPGMRLDCSSTKAANGANVYLYTAHGGANQLWKPVKAGETGTGAAAYYLNSGAYSGSPSRGLDLPGVNAASSGANVTLYSNDGGADQMWAMVGTGDKGYYYIRNAQNSAVSLDVENAGTTNGTNVRVSINNTSSAQKWRVANLLTAEAYSAAAAAGAALEFIPQNAVKTRLDLKDGSASPGANVQIYESNQDNRQRWSLELMGDDTVGGVLTPYYRIVSVATGTALDLASSTYGAGVSVVCNAPISVYASNANTQFWYLQEVKTNTYNIACRGNTDYVLTVANNGTGNGTNVQIDLKTGGENQKWVASGVDNVQEAAEEAIAQTNKDDMGGRTLLLEPSDSPEFWVWGNGDSGGMPLVRKANNTDDIVDFSWTFIKQGEETFTDTDGSRLRLNYYQIIGGANSAYDLQEKESKTYGKFASFDAANSNDKAHHWYAKPNEDGTYDLIPRSDPGLVLSILVETNTNYNITYNWTVLRKPDDKSAKTWNLIDVTEDKFHGQNVGLEPRNAPNKFLTVMDNSNTDSANVEIRTATTDTHMQWTFIRAGVDAETAKPYYRILNKGSNRVLDVQGGKIQSGTNVLQYTYHGGNNQLWYVEETETDGYYKIASRGNADLVLDVQGSKDADGTNVQIYTGNDSDAQTWKLVGRDSINAAAAIASDPFDGKYFTLAPGHAADMRLDLVGDGTGNGTQVQLYEEQVTDVQKWKFEVQGSESVDGKLRNYYMIVSVYAEGKALDSSTGTPSNGTRPHLWTYNTANKHQHWYIENAGGGYYYIIPREAQTKVLDCSGDDNGKSNNTVVQLWDRQSTATDQKWRIVETAETKELGTYHLQSALGRNLDIALGGSNKLVLWTTRSNDGGRWKFIQMGADSIDGKQVPFYRIQNKYTGNVMDPNNFNSITADSQLNQYAYDKGKDQMWYLEDAGDGYYYIVNRLDRNYCVTVKDSKTDNGTAILISKKANGSNQKWYLASYMEPVVYGTFEIAPVAAPDLRADLTGGSHDNGANIQLWHRNGAKAQQWTLTQLGTDLVDGEEKAYYSVKSVESGKYWDVPTSDGTITGYNVQQYDNDGYSDMHYYLEDQGDGTFVIRNRRDTSYVLEAEGTEDGKNIKIGTESSGSSLQRWILHKVTTEDDTAWQYGKVFSTEQTLGSFVLSPQHKTDFVMGVKGNSNDYNNVAIVQTDSDGTNYQIWKFIQVGTDVTEVGELAYYRIQNTGSGNVAETTGYRTPAANTTVRPWAYDHAYDQLWYLEESGEEGVYYITNRGDRTLCLGIRNSAKAKDSQVTVLNKTGGNNQQWKLEVSE